MIKNFTQFLNEDYNKVVGEKFRKLTEVVFAAMDDKSEHRHIFDKIEFSELNDNGGAELQICATLKEELLITLTNENGDTINDTLQAVAIHLDIFSDNEEPSWSMYLFCEDSEYGYEAIETIENFEELLSSFGL